MYSFQPVAQKASNLRGGSNSSYAVEDFHTDYPQFWGADSSPRVPREVMRMYVDFAHAVIKQRRYHGAWRIAMGLFSAHFLTLYMQAAVDPASDDAQVVAAGQLRGLMASKSVDGVSISMDYSTAIADLDGWAAWKLTTYGAQLATMAKTYGIGGMYVR